MKYKDVLILLKDNGDFNYIDNLSEKELDQILDFEAVYKKILNPDNNSNLDCLITLIFTVIIRIYFDYKEDISFISSNDVKYSNYFIQPVNGKYSLLDFLINVLIENIQVITCSNNVFSNEYNFARRELVLKANRYEEVNLSPLNKAQLYYKSINHEVGHAMHSVVSNKNDNVILRLYNPFVCSEKEAYNAEVFDFYKRFHLYRSLSSKYNILEEKSFHFEFCDNQPLISGFHHPFLEEAFTEMKAEDYMGVDPDTYIRSLGRYFFASHTKSNGYSLMSNYLRTISISKKNEFNVAYLGYPGEEIFKDYDNLIHSLTLLHPNYDTSDEEMFNIFKKRYLEDSNPNLLNYPFLIEGDNYIFMNELLLREKSSHRA